MAEGTATAASEGTTCSSDGTLEAASVALAVTVVPASGAAVADTASQLPPPTTDSTAPTTRARRRQ